MRNVVKRAGLDDSILLRSVIENVIDHAVSLFEHMVI
jgi:hypothetical protein